jgi:dihydroorotase-like cyclic amidohydrolase
VLSLRALLRTGTITWIETDHAPHRSEEKAYDPSRSARSYMSGIRSLENYSEFLNKLANQGYTKEAITKLTYTNIKNVFTKVVE